MHPSFILLMPVRELGLPSVVIPLELMLNFSTKQTTADGALETPATELIPKARPVTFRFPASSGLSGKRMNVSAAVRRARCCEKGGGG